MRYIFLIISVLFSFSSTPAQAQDAPAAFRSTNYPLPRFVSLGSDEIYVRAGPGPRFPVQWVFKKKGLPVEIILEYDHWRKIRDSEGETGWVHKSLLSGRRSALVTEKSNVAAYKKPNDKSALMAYLEPSLIVRLESCEAAWCHIEAKGYKGWVEKSALWGVYPAEKFD